MKYVLIILFYSSICFGQVFKLDMEKEKQHTFIEKLGASLLATAIYAGTDALMYPIAERNNFVNEWRISQGVIIGITTYHLSEKYGLKCGVSFLSNIVCGVPDLIYYGFHKSEFRDDNLSHLKFLPTASHKVKKTDLYSSVIIGLSFNITLSF